MKENNSIIDKEGTKKWYKNGQLHRNNDQPRGPCSKGT